MRRFLIATLGAAAFIFLLGGAVGASAAPLNLTSNPPDILSLLIDVDYTGGILTASGTAFTFDDDGVGTPEMISDGTFALMAVIDSAGNASSGSLSIGGMLNGFGPSLLMGTLVDFGFGTVGNGEPLEFLFDLTGGDLAGLYPGVAGVILTSTGFNGSFASNFANDGFGLADTAPEPSLIGLLLGSAGLLVAGRRRPSA